MKLALLKALRSVSLTPTAKDILSFFIDEAASRQWSTERLALAVRKHPRTVDMALSELRSAGFIQSVYRRRKTSVKVLCADAILAAVKHGVQVAKMKAAAAISLLRRGIQASQRISANVHLGKLKDEIGGSWRVQASPSASLLASLGMQTGNKRR
jgi:DNA-binding transcriptional ArsR family regulator